MSDVVKANSDNDDGISISSAEFIALVAALTAMVAMSTDVILPALGAIGQEFAADDPNQRQLTITLFFLGLAVSQIVYGPLSDSFGRRFGIFLGLGIYMFGTGLCLLSDSLTTLIVGRIVQGIGAAGPRIVAQAVVRDRFVGRDMARISSLIMMVFIAVPVLAPLIGQGIMMLTPWHGVFWALALFATLCAFWTFFRLEESLSKADRIPFRLQAITNALRQILTNRLAMGGMLTMGLVMSAFISFLSSSQQILGEAYGFGESFPLVFSSLAIGMGVTSALNSRLVMRFGMQRLATIGISAICILSATFSLWSVLLGVPPVWMALVWLGLSISSVGIILGNLNAMSMEPLGAVAGIGAGVLGSVTSLMAALIGSFIAGQYNGTALPVSLGFTACTTLALVILRWATLDRVRRVR